MSNNFEKSKFKSENDTNIESMHASIRRKVEDTFGKDVLDNRVASISLNQEEKGTVDILDRAKPDETKSTVREGFKWSESDINKFIDGAKDVYYELGKIGVQPSQCVLYMHQIAQHVDFLINKKIGDNNASAEDIIKSSKKILFALANQDYVLRAPFESRASVFLASFIDGRTSLATLKYSLNDKWPNGLDSFFENNILKAEKVGYIISMDSINNVFQNARDEMMSGNKAKAGELKALADSLLLKRDKTIEKITSPENYFVELASKASASAIQIDELIEEKAKIANANISEISPGLPKVYEKKTFNINGVESGWEVAGLSRQKINQVDTINSDKYITEESGRDGESIKYVNYILLHLLKEKYPDGQEFNSSDDAVYAKLYIMSDKSLSSEILNLDDTPYTPISYDEINKLNVEKSPIPRILNKINNNRQITQEESNMLNIVPDRNNAFSKKGLEVSEKRLQEASDKAEKSLDDGSND